MICVDTSVWISALRGDSAAIAVHLRGLLELDQVLLPVPVHIELLSGIRGKRDAWLRGDLQALHRTKPGERTWSRIEIWCERATGAGERFGFADLLIASLAADARAQVWSLDHAFARMHALGFIERYEPGS